MAEHNQRFDSFDQWVNKASSWLTRHPNFDVKSFRAICFDSKGRLCQRGADMMRARDEGAFPVRWVWPDQIAKIVSLADLVDDLRKALEEARESIQLWADIASDGTRTRQDTSDDIAPIDAALARIDALKEK